MTVYIAVIYSEESLEMGEEDPLVMCSRDMDDLEEQIATYCRDVWATSYWGEDDDANNLPAPDMPSDNKEIIDEFFNQRAEIIGSYIEKYYIVSCDI